MKSEVIMGYEEDMTQEEPVEEVNADYPTPDEVEGEEPALDVKQPEAELEGYNFWSQKADENKKRDRSWAISLVVVILVCGYGASFLAGRVHYKSTVKANYNEYSVIADDYRVNALKSSLGQRSEEMMIWANRANAIEFKKEALREILDKEPAFNNYKPIEPAVDSTKR